MSSVISAVKCVVLYDVFVVLLQLWVILRTRHKMTCSHISLIAVTLFSSMSDHVKIEQDYTVWT